MHGGQVCADRIAEGGISADDHGGQLPTGRQQAVQQLAGHRGQVGADDHDVTLGGAQRVARPAPPGGGERLLVGDGDLGPAGGGRRLGHGDHVVAEAAPGVGDGDGGQPLHGRAAGDDRDVAPLLAGAGGGAGGERGQPGVVGQDDDVGGGAGEDLGQDVVLAHAVGAAGDDPDPLGSEQPGQSVAV